MSLMSDTYGTLRWHGILWPGRIRRFYVSVNDAPAVNVGDGTRQLRRGIEARTPAHSSP